MSVGPKSAIGQILFVFLCVSLSHEEDDRSRCVRTSDHRARRVRNIGTRRDLQNHQGGGVAIELVATIDHLTTDIIGGVIADDGTVVVANMGIRSETSSGLTSVTLR
jgi:hypothetical protein